MDFNMIKNLTIFAAFAVGSFLIFSQFQEANAELKPYPAPEFTQDSAEAWINSKPLDKSHFKGKVTLIDIWTFACWNCYRSFPWLNQTEEKYKNQGFNVIGIHSPEFDYEKVRSSIVEKTKEFKLKHPVMIDNDFKYWRKLNNQYWPTYYLVDKKGMIRYRFIGETHANTRKANVIEAAIEKLLAES